MTNPESSRQWAAWLASMPTAASVFADYVGDLAPVATDQLHTYIQQLPLPSGWLPTQFDDPELIQPLRMAVRPNSEGGWDGYETLAVFGFTGTPPPPDLVDRMTEQALHGLGADTITTSTRKIPSDLRISSARSSGEIDLAGQRVWLQYTIYLAGAQPPELQILIEHVVVVAAVHRADLHHDVDTLTIRCHGAVESIRDAVRNPDAQAAFEAERPTLRIQPYDDMGIPSILANANRNGMRMLRTAAQSALTGGEHSFTVDGVTHRILQQADAAELKITPGAVTWRLGTAQLSELLEMLEPLIIFWNPGHNYFDLDLDAGPAEQLVLAVDEWVGSAPYGEFPELSPLPPATERPNPHD